MRTPIRRSNKIPGEQIDTKITLEKYQTLQKILKKLKEENRPAESEEVKVLSTTGDYSENAGYQAAKAKLRRTNNKITKIEYILARADIIETNKKRDKVELGSLVELKSENTNKKYQILGSAETNPSQGKISYSSPLGSALLDKKVGETVKLKDKKYTIVNIS
jgi:transcription elongation factor GreA